MILVDLTSAVTQLAADTATGLAAAVPDPPPVRPPGAGKLEKMAGWVMWIAGLVLVVAAAVAGIKLATDYDHARGNPDGLKKLGWVCAGAIVVGSASAIVKLMM